MTRLLLALLSSQPTTLTSLVFTVKFPRHHGWSTSPIFSIPWHPVRGDHGGYWSSTSASFKRSPVASFRAVSQVHNDQKQESMNASTPSPTLGVVRSLLHKTFVPGLSSAVLKQSPSDFVVVEIPLYGGTRFTAANASELLSEEVKKPIAHKVQTGVSCDMLGIPGIKEWVEKLSTERQTCTGLVISA